MCEFFLFLRGLDTLGSFSVIFTRETTFVTSSLLSGTSIPSEKSSTLKGKNLLPLGFFPFRLLFRMEAKHF